MKDNKRPDDRLVQKSLAATAKRRKLLIDDIGSVREKPNIIDSANGNSFFQLPLEEQVKYKVKRISFPELTFQKAKYAIEHGPLLKKVAWMASFEEDNGIMSYTKMFVKKHGDRGVVVTRATVEKFWVKAVKKNFKGNKEKKQIYLQQVRTAIVFILCAPSRRSLATADMVMLTIQQTNCALNNEYWVQHTHEPSSFSNGVMKHPSGSADATGYVFSVPMPLPSVFVFFGGGFPRWFLRLS